MKNRIVFIGILLLLFALLFTIHMCVPEPPRPKAKDLEAKVNYKKL